VTSEPGAPGRLAFIAHASTAFQFLKGSGFRTTRTEPTFVRFESGDVYVQVFHGRSSFAVGVEFGRLNVSGEVLTLAEALAALCPERVPEAHHQASNEDSLRRGLEGMAQITRACCGDLLLGDKSTFERVEAVANELRKARTLDAQFGAIRDKAESAWSNKNYPEACRLYSEMAEVLTETEKRRLEYSRKRLQ